MNRTHIVHMDTILLNHWTFIAFNIKSIIYYNQNIHGVWHKTNKQTINNNNIQAQIICVTSRVIEYFPGSAVVFVLSFQFDFKCFLLLLYETLLLLDINGE